MAALYVTSSAAPSWAAPPACPSFKKLPKTVYHKSTLIEDDCLDIPKGTTIRVEEGVSLYIIAHKELRIGDQVTFDARGRAGDKGPHSDLPEVIWGPDEGSVCDVCGRNACGCPGPRDGQEHLWGHTGGTGGPGGQIRIVSRKITMAAPATGEFNVGGGTGGPAGDSGSTSCSKGRCNCRSPACTGPITVQGSGGSAGGATFFIGDPAAASLLDQLKASVVPAGRGAGSLAATPEAIKNEEDRAENESNAGGWDRLPGA